MRGLVGTKLRAGAVAVALTLGLIAAAPATAGGGSDGDPNLYFLKKSGGQSYCCITANFKPGQTKTFQAVATNSGGSATFLLDGFSNSSAEYKVDWYRGLKAKASKKITSEVRGSGYEFAADSETATPFTVVIKRKQGDQGCIGGALTSTPGSTASFGTIEVNGGLCIF